jgi:muramidase (phage lysozyme)
MVRGIGAVMNRTLLAAAVVVAAAAWWWTQGEEEGGGVLPEVLDGAAQAVDAITGGVMKLSEMARVSAAVLQDRNVKAFLQVIRKGEGTGDAGGYSRLFGGGTFASFADHPRITVRRSGYTSTAAGAYQFLQSTWDETRRIMGLTSFSPASQDLGAVGRIAARGALADVIAGRLEAAIKKCAKEWASLPYSPYGQPVISMSTARAVFAGAGGDEAGIA